MRQSSFNMDDYLSSEDEMEGEPFLVSKRPKMPDDETLLFNDAGYGMRGTQLPGLFEAIPEIPYESPPKSSQYLSDSFSRRPLAPLSRPPDFSPRPYALETDDEDELGGLGEEAPLPIRDISARVKAMRAALYEAIAEEKLGKVDVKAAVRMRKEAKARERASARKANGRVDLDDGHHADVE